MNRTTTAFACLALLAATATMPLAADAPRLTVLPNGEALVAETVDLPAGAAGRLELPRPDTLLFETMVATLGTSDEPLTLRFAPPLDGVQALLTACIGRTVRLLPAGPQAEAGGLPEKADLVAAGDLPLVRLASGEVVPVRAERVACVLDGDGRVRVGVQLPEHKAATALHLRYRLNGFAWQARHRLDLDESGTKARLASTAVIDLPHGVAFDNALLRLAEGDVPRSAPPMDMEFRAKGMMTMAAQAAPAPSEESSTLDLMLFDIPGKWTLAGPSRLSLPLRAATTVAVNDVMVLELNRWQQPGNQFQPLAPRRHLRFKIAGDNALPGGLFDVGVDRADGTWLPLGEVRTPRIAAGRTTEIVLGEVRDVAIEYRQPTLTELRETRFQREATFELKVENHRAQRATVEIVHNFFAAYQLLDSSTAPAQQDGTRLTWSLALAPNASTTLTYRVRIDPRPVKG